MINVIKVIEGVVDSSHMEFDKIIRVANQPYIRVLEGIVQWEKYQKVHENLIFFKPMV